jgi:hypothetical protein
MLVPLAIGAVLGYPGRAWPVRFAAESRAFASRHRLALGVAVALWLLVAVVANLRAPAVGRSKLGLFVVALVAAGAYAAAEAWIVRRRPESRLLGGLGFAGALTVGFGVGVFVPVGLLLGDGLRALKSVASTLAGGNVQSNIAAFNEPGFVFTSFPVLEAGIVFVVAAVAAATGLWKREIWPVVLFAGAAVAAIMAAGRGLGETRYFAIPFVLSIPPALWLCSRGRGALAPLLGAALVAVVVVPLFRHSGDDAAGAKRYEAENRVASGLADRLLKPGQAAIVPDEFPSPDDLWYTLVEIYASPHPFYRYRLIDNAARELPVVQQRGLKLRYFVGPVASTTGPTTLKLAFGTYTAVPVKGTLDPATGIGALKLVSGPYT